MTVRTTRAVTLAANAAVEVTDRPRPGRKAGSVRLPSGADGADGVKPAIDLGDLDNRLGYFVRRAQVAIFQDFYATCSEVDIRPVQYSILTIIEHNPGLSQTRVAETLGIKKTNFVAMLDTLEGRGLVRRAPTPGDRRTYALYLTEDGKQFMRKLHKMVAMHESRIIEQIGADMHARMFGALKSITKLGRAAARRR